jgi:hypothetical protein
MMQSTPSANGLSLTFVEGTLTAIAAGLCFAFPSLARGLFAAIERQCMVVTQRRALAVAAVGLALLLLRLVLLPWLPAPLPFTPNDFSFMLGADTLLHGRLANPTPSMWVHFETIHVDMRPMYASMYFPAQAMVMAAGKLVLGHAWAGILFASAAMCSAICWALQAWLPARWALLGGMLAVMHIGLFSYWTNSYSGAGALAALGGALVIGALPRLIRSMRLNNALWMALGVVLLLLTRPYEGFLLCLPSGIYLLLGLLRNKKRLQNGALTRNICVAAVVIVAAFAWLGYYDWRAYGSPLKLPYAVNRAAYAQAPYYVWQQARPEPPYNHQEMRRFYVTSELETYNKIHSLSGFIPQTLVKAARGILFFAGMAFLPLLVSLRRALRDRRMHFFAVCLAVMLAGMLIEIFFIPHYIAPFTVVIYAVGLQCMRHLRQWKPGGNQVGVTLSRLSIAVCLCMAILRIFNQPLHLVVRRGPPSNWTDHWYGPDLYGVEHARAIEAMNRLPGKQLAVVRYSASHDPSDEWVYNGADIDSSKVIWARDMGPDKNRELLDYYKDRKVWLVQPDVDSASITPYR